MNTSQKGDALEIAVFDLLKAQIDADRFFAKKECCSIFRRKGYYSEKRKANIVFDISIEIRFPGAVDYSMLILIECKNYAKSVPVDDVEEFSAKVDQVGEANTKGIFVSNNALQSSALRYCKSQGMGVARYFDGQDLKWELRRSASASFASQSGADDTEAYAGLTLPDYKSSVFELYMQSSRGATNSLNTFVEDLAFTVSQRTIRCAGCLAREPSAWTRYRFWRSPRSKRSRTRRWQASAPVPRLARSSLSSCAQFTRRQKV
ncbi:hypothetical protein C8236_01000 [Paracidovorax avenae]|uniref:restriction endonuclease n=1 Tax=Paracidovorax avenae TaxID=80867 RepID=UPI000D211247|nr:restriction endonuclease [Paracidovorax avenae]AVS97540.1 hypothetical protein C8236_01000 [Paracidovorax avenae]